MTTITLRKGQMRPLFLLAAMILGACSHSRPPENQGSQLGTTDANSGTGTRTPTDNNPGGSTDSEAEVAVNTSTASTPAEPASDVEPASELVSCEVFGATGQTQSPPTPRPGTGHARGVMLFQHNPRKGVPIYLHRTSPDVAAWSPSACTDEDGHWTALNLPPGNYITTAFLPQGPLMYSTSDVRILEAGETIDFGTENTQAATGMK